MLINLYSFEKFLVYKGYKPFTLDLKSWVYKPITNLNHSFSSMGDLDRYWIKNNNCFCFGLNDYKKPPTLVRPRPNFIILNKDGNIINFDNFDDGMNIILASIDNDIIYDAIIDNTKILKLQL